MPVSGTALLLIDVINDLAFDGSGPLVAQAEPMAAPTRARSSVAPRPPACRRSTSTTTSGSGGRIFARTVAHCTARSSPGRRVSRRLRPTARDYFVLKPKHSGFFDTTLDTLLETLRIRRVILTGIAGNICVLFTANDAYMRDSRFSRPPIASSRTRPPTTTTPFDKSTIVLKGNVTTSSAAAFPWKAARRDREPRR